MQVSKDVIFLSGNNPKLIHMFYTTPIKTTARFYPENAKMILKFIRRCKGPRIAKSNLKKNTAGRSHPSRSPTCYGSTATHTAGYWPPQAPGLRLPLGHVSQKRPIGEERKQPQEKPSPRCDGRVEPPFLNLIHFRKLLEK